MDYQPTKDDFLRMARGDFGNGQHTVEGMLEAIWWLQYCRGEHRVPISWKLAEIGARTRGWWRLNIRDWQALLDEARQEANTHRRAAEVAFKAQAELQTRISFLEEHAAGLQAERDTLMRLLESLTPGGSEYHNDPARCAERIRSDRSTTAKIAKERNELRAQLAEALGIAAELSGEVERLRAQLSACEWDNARMKLQMQRSNIAQGKEG